MCSGLVTGVDCHSFSFTLQVGGTALLWSSSSGYTKIVEMLIECGASLSVQAKVSFTRKYWQYFITWQIFKPLYLGVMV